MLRGPAIHMETLLFGTLQHTKTWIKSKAPENKDLILEAQQTRCAPWMGCYAPGHLAHIFLSFLVRYVLIQSPDLNSHDCLPVHQSPLVRNFIVPSFCTFPIVLPLW